MNTTNNRVGRPRLHTTLLATGLLLGFALACTGSRPNPEHCWNAEGDATCADRYGAELPYCTNATCDPSSEGNYGCVAELPSDECYSPCGGEQTVVEDDACLGTAEDSTSGSETAETTAESTDSETSAGPCMSDAECGGGTPFCGEQGECVGCSEMPNPDDACGSLDGGAQPVCDEGTNTCVECAAGQTEACVGVTPLCDESTNTCVGCRWHEECASACQMKEGSCFPESPLNQFKAGTGLGYTSLNEALDEIAMLDPPVGVVVVYDTTDLGPDYVESVVVPAGMIVAFLAAPELSEAPEWLGQGAPALTIESGAVVYVQGLRLADTAGGNEGIVNSGEAWVDRSEVVNNTGGGIVVDNGGALVLRNSFVGGDVSDQRALDIVDGVFDIQYSTLAAGFGTSVGLSCADGAGSSARNSLVVSRSSDDEVQCPNAVITDSALEMMLDSNVSLGVMATGWFTSFATGDFHLAASPAAIGTAAAWQADDPLVDIDGDARPTTPGAEDYAGADRP